MRSTATPEPGKPSIAAALPDGGREPLWRQLLQTLRGDIANGVFPIGSQLPTEEDLCTRFAVSRHTVREALRQLRADGLVSSRQGSGTTVMPPATGTPFNVHRVASIDELIAYAAETRYDIESTEMVTTTVADESKPQSWLRLQGYRHHLADETATPICWTDVYIASEFAGIERSVHRQRTPVWQLIEDMYGERLIEVEQTLSVGVVPDAIANGLQVEPGSSVVKVRRIYRTSSGKIAEVSINLYPADQFQFSMKLRRA